MRLLILFIPFLLFSFDYKTLQTKRINKIISFFDNKTKKTLNIPFDIFQCQTNDDNISNRLNLAKYEYYNSNLGISFFSNGFINDKKNKSLSIGLKWRVLKGGYYQNKEKAQILSLQQNSSKQKLKNVDYLKSFNLIIYYFNLQKIAVIEQYKKFLALQYKIYKFRFFAKQQTFPKILNIKRDIDMLNNLEKEYILFNQKILCKKNIPFNINVYLINYDKVFNDVKNMKLSNIAYNNLYSNIDDTLNFYVAHELIGKTTKIGFNLDIPLGKKDTKEIQKLQKLKQISTNNEKKDLLLMYLNKNYYTIRYKLNDLINLEYKKEYVKKQFHRALLRYRFKIGGDNLVRIISNIKSQFDIKLQILDVKQQLFLQEYSLLYNLNLPISNKYVKKYKINTNLKIRDGIRSIYIWANGFKKYKNTLLIELLKTKDISTALLSVSKYQNLKKLEKFVTLANKNDIKIEFLIFNKKWLYKKNRKLLDKKLQYILINLGNTINLDIHTKDYKRYFNLIKYIKQKYPFIIMNLTNSNEKFIKKVSNYINIIYSKNDNIPKKDIIIIDLSKFGSEFEFEIFISDFVEKSNHKKIAIDNLKKYIKVLEN